MSPMLLTQPKIGPKLADEDVTNGVSKEHYAGDGPKYDPKSIQQTVDIGTGLYEEIAPPVTPRNRQGMVLKNKQFFASPIQHVGHLVFDTWRNHNIDARPREVVRSLFPRSIVYELEYIKNENRKVMMAALDKERKAFEDKKMMKQSKSDDGSLGKDSSNPSKHEPPFWWCDSPGLIQPPIEKRNIICDMGLHSDQDHQPGEIHNGRKTQIDLSKGHNHMQQTPHSSMEYAQHSVPSQSKPESLLATNAPSAGPECMRQLGCQFCNRQIHQHLGQVANSTVWQPVVQHEKEDAAEVTAGGCMSVSNICGCHSFKQGNRTHIEQHQTEQYEFPYSKIKYTPYNDEERQDELFKVGHPFRTMASRWMDANKDPLPFRTTLNVESK